MDPTGDILSTWRALVNPDASIEDCQSALLRVPGTQSFTFEADASATPADVHGVESGGSILLDSASPAAKAMAKTAHVGVGVVSLEDCCLGVFNAKDARARMDPVVRVCSLPRLGKGGCTNTSHTQQKISFQGKRILIKTPIVSRATIPAYFSLPYLKVEALPPVSELNTKLLALQAPVGVWRSFFDGSAGAIAKIFPDFSSIVSPQASNVLKVDTAFSAEPSTSHHGIIAKEESPLSYDLLADFGAVPDGTEECKDEVGSIDQDFRSPSSKKTSTIGATDFFDSNTDVIDAAGIALDLGAGLSGAEPHYNVQAVASDIDPAPKPTTRIAYSDASDDDSESSSETPSLSHSLPSRRGPPARDAPAAQNKGFPASDVSLGSKQLGGTGSLNGDAMGMLLLQQVLTSQQNMETRVRSLEKDNTVLRRKLKQVKSVADKALNVGATLAATQAETNSKILEDLARLQHQFTAKTGALDLNDLLNLKNQVSAFLKWRETVNDRIGSLEVDMRNEDGLLFTQVRECRSAVAAGDLGAFTIASHTFQNEESVLAFIQTLPGKNNYVTFPSMKDFFSLCGDPVSSLSENMVLHKATKGADFEDTFTARVNTAHVVGLPAVFARKSTSGDTFKTIWTPAFKSYSSFSGGMKNGGRTSVERQLRKVQEMYRGQIRRRLPPHVYPHQNAVATAMADKAFLAAFDFLDSVSKFYFTMLSAGLPEGTAWSNTQEMILRVHEEFEMASCEAAEEDVDAGFIWSSMMISNKVDEFQRFRWGEHPSICSMLMFSILERLGDYQVPSEDTLAAEAMEKCKQNDQVLQELLEKVRKDHETASNAVNQVKQLKEALAKEKKDSGNK